MYYPDEKYSSIEEPLREMNPWWEGNPMSQRVPASKRHVWRRLEGWLSETGGKYAINVVGPRFVGKTTVMRQLIGHLLSKGVPGTSILYAKFDDNRLDGRNFNEVVNYWAGKPQSTTGKKYLLFDEVQLSRHWESSIKNMVDDYEDRKILFTGSSLTMDANRRETGVGRWIDEYMGTLSFGEYLEITRSPTYEIPELDVGAGIDWGDWLRLRTLAEELGPMFDKYLLRGGFPESALMDNEERARKNLIDQSAKLLTRELPAFYGIGDYWDLRAVHEYFTDNDCGIVNYNAISSSMEVNKRAAKNLVNALLAGMMVNLLPGMSLGKEALKGRRKYYVTDHSRVAALRDVQRGDLHGAVGGQLVESTVFHHLHQNSMTSYKLLAYWRDKQQNEVDFVVRFSRDGYVPVEVKYRTRTRARASLRGLEHLHRDKKFERCYIVTKNPSDIGQEKLWPADPSSPTITRLPAPVFCLLQSIPEPGKGGKPWL